MATIKTKIHVYKFDTSKPSEKYAYEELKTKLRATLGRGHRMHCLASFDKELELSDGPIELETKHLFSNQWNSAPYGKYEKGIRCFDWYEAIYPNAHYKQGHYLDITQEMIDIRQHTDVCGYCGRQYDNQWYIKLSDGGIAWAADLTNRFCEACLDSPYLKAEELHLLRLLPIALDMPTRAPLTPQEQDHLIPLFVERQTVASDSRAVKKRKKEREDIEERFERKNATYRREHDGMIWLWEHHVNLDNVIFYEHTGVFSFGWRAPVDAAVKARLLDIMVEFPFPYEIKAVDGTVTRTAA